MFDKDIGRIVIGWISTDVEKPGISPFDPYKLPFGISRPRFINGQTGHLPRAPNSQGRKIKDIKKINEGNWETNYPLKISDIIVFKNI